MVPVKQIVNSFPTKNKEGFTNEEIELLIKSKFSQIKLEDIKSKLGVRTVRVINEEIVTFSSDIITAITCVIEKRDPNMFEFD
jgi:hypothetical protein